MALPRRILRRMYAVSCEGIGVISGTMAYSRREAIQHFFGGAIIAKEWEAHKRSGYQTVKCGVVIEEKKP